MCACSDIRSIYSIFAATISISIASACNSQKSAPLCKDRAAVATLAAAVPAQGKVAATPAHVLALYAPGLLTSTRARLRFAANLFLRARIAVAKSCVRSLRTYNVKPTCIAVTMCARAATFELLAATTLISLASACDIYSATLSCKAPRAAPVATLAAAVPAQAKAPAAAHVATPVAAVPPQVEAHAAAVPSQVPALYVSGPLTSTRGRLKFAAIYLYIYICLRACSCGNIEPHDSAHTIALCVSTYSTGK